MRLRQAALLGWGLLLLGLLLAALGTCIGSAGFENLLRPLLDANSDPAERDMAWQIVTEIRLPRTLGAWAAGSLWGSRAMGVGTATIGTQSPATPCRAPFGSAAMAEQRDCRSQPTCA